LPNVVERHSWEKPAATAPKPPDAHEDERRFTAGRACMLIGTALVPILLLFAIAVGLLYVRLVNGPISLAFLKGPIERSISAELPGFKIRIGQPVMALRDRGFELRLTNVQLTDKTGKRVAVAPLAAVEVSPRALLAGIISPSQIVLIEPQLLVFYTPEDGLSLTIDTKRNGRAATSLQSGFTQEIAGMGQREGTKAGSKNIPVPRLAASEVAGRINLAQTITNLTQRARQQSDATSYLDRIGLRNATVIVDHGGIRTALRVPAANFDLAHSDVRSVVSGNIVVASKRGTWRIGMRVEDAQDKNQVRLTAVVKDLYPQAIADAMPKFKALNQLQLPISAKADYILSSQGEVLAGVFDIALGAGEIQIPFLGENFPSLSSGRARLIYSRGQDHIKLETVALRWAQSSLVFSGLIRHRLIGSTVTAWDFELESSDGHLATTGDGAFVKIKRWTANGTVLPAQGIINLDKSVIEAGGGSLLMDGVLYTGRSPGFSINGRLSPMSVQNVLAYWPQYLGAKARKWAAQNILAGQLRAGTFAARLRSSSGENATDANTSADYNVAISAELADVRFQADDKLPPIYAAKAYLDFKDAKFHARLPQSVFVISDDQSLLMSDLSFTTTSLFEPDIDGRTQFKVNGSANEAIAIIRQLNIKGTETLTGLQQRFSGQIKGNFDIVTPITRTDEIPPPKITAQILFVDGRAENIWKTLDVNGSNVKIDINQNDIVANGDVLLKGIPINISWRKNLRNNRKALPITLSATLDDADRNALGLSVNHLMKGPIQISAVIPPPTAEGEAKASPMHFRIDLTAAALDITSLAWKKPIGRKTFLDFDIETQADKGWRLSNLRIDGDNVAAKGSAHINPQGEFLSFDIEDFAIDVVTRLKIKGELRNNNVWRVSVRGKSFEGRNFFRALFSTQNSGGKTASGPEPGLDLDVNIDNVLGYWDTSLRNLRLDLSKRNGRITAVSAYGKFKNNKLLRASLRRKSKVRQLVITSNDAGKAFKLVGFYPNVRGGSLESITDLQGNKAGARRGLLTVRRFDVLGDQIVSEVLSKQRRRRARNTDAEREVIQFDWMRIPFAVGSGRFVLRDAELRGPLLGVLLCGKADFTKRQMQVAGTYIPLQGLSAVVGAIPGIGNLLAGQRGEGIIGINFEIRGSMQQPQVLINPLSAVTPGIFREVFKVACPDSKFVLGSQWPTRGANVKQPKIDQSWTSETFESSN